MSHLSSPPPKHKGEHKGHGLPRGSERWVGLGAGGSGGEVPEGRGEWSGAELWGKPRREWAGKPSLHLPARARCSSSRDKDRSVTVSSSGPMPAGGKGSRTNCSPSTPQKVPNRLINEKSPYLLQHAYNPVDW